MMHHGGILRISPRRKRMRGEKQIVKSDDGGVAPEGLEIPWSLPSSARDVTTVVDDGQNAKRRAH